MYDFRLVFMQIQVFWEISWTVCNLKFEEISFSEIPVTSSWNGFMFQKALIGIM